MNKKDLLLYCVTDRAMVKNCSLEKAIETAINNGVSMVQLREKNLPFDEFCEKAFAMKKICDKQGVPLIINDNVEVCREVNASGVHLGSSDCNIAIARNILGQNKIIGASARDEWSAIKAEKMGADYLGVGAVFGTNTKLDAKTISPEIVKNIAKSVTIPVVAIGGVCEQNINQLKGTGIAGVAVVSAILKSDDIAESCKKLISELQKVVD